MRRGVKSILHNKKLIILTGGEYDKKLKDDFISFFHIERYKEFNLGENKIPEIDKKHCLVVLCTYDKEKNKAILKKYGFRYRKEYVLAEDLFKSIDLDLIHDCKKLYLYTKDKSLKDKVYIFSQVFRIIHHIDDEDKKAELEIVRIIFYATMLIVWNLFRRKIVFCKDLDNVHPSNEDFICVGATDEENCKILYQEGIMNGYKVYTMDMLKRYCFASKLLRQTYLDKRQNKCQCVLPYEMFYINPNGDIWLCPCFGELNVSDLIGNTAEEAWNSPIANIMRLSIENNTYTFCDRRCKEFWGYEDREEILERKNLKLPLYPSSVFVSFDKACNLKCKSCRLNHYVKNSYEKEQLILHYADLIKNSGWLEKCNILTIGGDGETFLSDGYKKILFEDACSVRKKVNIMTNGTLFTPKIWEQIEGKYEYIMMSVSIDATTEETYKKIRGGKFRQLMKNMEFLSKLRKENKVNYVRVKMVVQESNYKEMKDFILWAKRLEFDSVYFSPIWNWGTYSDSEFKRISIFSDKDETKIKLKVKEYLKDEIFRDPIVSVRWN